MILLILGFVFLICSLILFYKVIQIKVNRNKEQENYEQLLRKQVLQLQQEREILLHKKEEINQDLLKWKKYRKEEIEAYIESQKQLADQTVNTVYESAQKQISDINNDIQKANNQAQQKITNIHTDLNKIRESAQKEKQQIQNDLNKLKSSLSAGVEARLREQQKKDKLNFYKLSLNNADFEDVKKLQDLKLSFHNPTILSKLIWTQYFQKQMTELCDRVFGKKVVCGIYKITDLLTQQCYIGQSVNIQQRMKQHCKCGLGIQASATNKLYNTMQKDKVWNFTFELLEQCPRQLLNEKEKFWIEMYQSNKFGLNTLKGNG